MKQPSFQAKWPVLEKKGEAFVRLDLKYVAFCGPKSIVMVALEETSRTRFSLLSVQTTDATDRYFIFNFLLGLMNCELLHSFLILLA